MLHKTCQPIMHKPRSHFIYSKNVLNYYSSHTSLKQYLFKFMLVTKNWAEQNPKGVSHVVKWVCSVVKCSLSHTMIPRTILVRP